MFVIVNNLKKIYNSYNDISIKSYDEKIMNHRKAELEMEEIFSLLFTTAGGIDKVLELLNTELSMPNIPMPTMGGEVFWETIIDRNGWKLQQNMFTHHARILDPNNIRKAWGTYNGMEKAMININKKLSNDISSGEEKENAYKHLRELQKLLDDGIITQSEYDEKRKKYVNII